mgnify:CR=1 FL=1
MLHKSLSLKTIRRCQFIDLMPQVREFLASAPPNGLLVAFCPHTTAGVTINEKADPDVARDILHQLEKMVPADPSFLHGEGNSDAHIKTLLTGVSVQVPVVDGTPLLGTWQTLFFCEYDGPRTRRLELVFYPG